MEPEEKATREENDGGEAGKRVRELEEQVMEKDRALAQADRRVAEIEAERNGLAGEVAALKEQNTAALASIETLRLTLSEAVKGYRLKVIEANPEIPDEMVAGESVGAIDDSVNKAKGLVSRVRQNIESNILASRVPAGAPVRTTGDISGLPAREKIIRGIGRE